MTKGKPKCSLRNRSADLTLMGTFSCRDSSVGQHYGVTENEQNLSMFFSILYKAFSSTDMSSQNNEISFMLKVIVYVIQNGE